MKILHIFKNYHPVIGGIENHIKNIAEFQAKNGHDVTVLATSPKGTTVIEEINSVRVIKAGSIATFASTPISISLFKYISGLKVDIAHLHFPYPVGEFAHLLFGHSSRTVITYHNDIVKQKLLLLLYKPFLLRTFKAADCILSTSPQLIRTSPILGKFSYKCRVVPYGIDISRFGNPDKKISDSIRAHGNRSPIVLFVGRLRYFKGIEYLIDAMKAVEAKLLIVGAGSEEKRLRARTSNNGLDSKVFFLGEVPYENMPEYFDACDLFVLPSSLRSESFGMVIIEAMACGKPVISTELGTGTSFVNMHGKTGFVVPPKDPGSLSGAINRILLDEALRKEFAVNARKRSEEFSEDRMNEKIINIYRELLEMGPGNRTVV